MVNVCQALLDSFCFPSVVNCAYKLIRKCLHSHCLNFLLVSGCRAPVQVVTTATEATVGGAVTLINSIRAHTNSTVVYHVVVGDQHTHGHLRDWLKGTALKSVPVNIVNLPQGVVPPSIRHPVSSRQKSMFAVSNSLSFFLSLSLSLSLSVSHSLSLSLSLALSLFLSPSLSLSLFFSLSSGDICSPLFTSYNAFSHRTCDLYITLFRSTKYDSSDY